MYTSNPEVKIPEDKRELGGAGAGGPAFSICCCFLPFTLISSVAAKLSCSYSGFSSPRVEWKFAQGDITSLVCYNNKITGESSTWVPGPQSLPTSLLSCLNVTGTTSPSSPAPPTLVPLPAAPFEDRVTFSNTGITFHSVTRKDTGMYTCMVSDEGGTAYGEVSVQLIVLGMCQVFCAHLASLVLPMLDWLCRTW